MVFFWLHEETFSIVGEPGDVDEASTREEISGKVEIVQ